MASRVANPKSLLEQEKKHPSSRLIDTSKSHTVGELSASKQRGIAPAEGWFVLILLAVAVYSVTLSIVTVNWVAHSLVLLWSPAVGLLTGLLVAKTPRMPQSVLHLGACLLGHWLSILLTSAFAFHVSWLLLLGILRNVILGGFNSSTVPNSEEMMFFFYLSFLCFFLGYFGSWLIYRAHLPWLVGFVYCSIMLVNLNYVKQDMTLLFVVLLCALLLLIARTHLTAQIAQWQREGLHTDRTWTRSITIRCMQVASLLTLTVILLSPLLPIVDQAQSGKAFWDHLNNVWTNILNGHISLQNPGSLLQSYQPPTNFFGDQLTISGSVHLPTGEVLNYTSSGGPQYLEGFTYNMFDGHTWSSTLDPNESHPYGPNVQLPVDVARDDAVQVQTTITVVHPPESTKHYIFGPAQPVGFDIATKVYTDGLPATTTGASNTTGTWVQESPLTVGERYKVTSVQAPAVTQASPYYKDVPLPADNIDFWDRYNYGALKVLYVQVPGDLSPNEQKTVTQWTSGATDTYTALKMLEAHLSDPNQFTYSLDNVAVPGNVNAVDWLLQTRKGYCTYYASAMSIMARQLGIPTRVVNGFSHGHFDTRRKVWIVQGDDAHSWVQAYLPEYGWVSFDPTPGFSLAVVKGAQPTPPPTVKPSPTKAGATVTPGKVTPPPTHPKKPTPPTGKSLSPTAPINTALLIWLAGIVFALSLLFFLAALGRYWWRSLYENSTFIAGMYWRVCYLARFVGLGPRAWQTPYEYSNVLIRQAPQGERMFRHLTELFVRDRWAAPYQAPQPAELQDAERLWPGLWRIMGKLFFRKIRK